MQHSLSGWQGVNKKSKVRLWFAGGTDAFQRSIDKNRAKRIHIIEQIF
jgi:hypothetical protein